MLRALTGFELSYHSRQISFRVAILLFAALGLLMSQGNFSGPEVYKNSPYVISYVTCFLSLFSIFTTTLFCANVVLRDATYRLESIIFTTSIERATYFKVRLMGLLLAAMVPVILATAGFLAGAGGGPFEIRYVLYPLLVLGVPNVLFVAGILFAAALLTRSLRAVYVAGVGLFVLYFLGSILGNSPLMASSLKVDQDTTLSYLLDPFGFTAFFGITRSFTPEEMNTRLLPLAGIFGINRLLWTVVAIVLLWVSYRYFKFRQVGEKGAAKATKTGKTAPVKRFVYQPAPVHTHGSSYTWPALASQLRLEIQSVFKHIPFLVLLLLWIFLNAVELKENVLHGPYGIRFFAASGLIAEALQTMRPALLLLVFYAAELLHRERTTRMQELIFSTPVRNSILWGAKYLTLCLLALLLVTTNILAGIGLQLAAGYPSVDWRIYASLYYYCGWPLLLYAALILFVQVLVSNKYLGMLLSLLVAGIFVFAGTLGIHSYLLKYATLPGLNYSAMNGFGHYTQAAGWYLLYWTAIAGLLALLSAAWWRGKAQWSKRCRVLLVVCLLVSMATGFYIYGESQLISMARGSKEARDWQAAYERKYKAQAGMAQPFVTAVNTQIDLYPEQQRYTVKGRYLLHNGSGLPVTTFWLGVNPEVTAIAFDISQAKQDAADPVFKQYHYRLATPMQPGEERSISFFMEVKKTGFQTFNKEHSVVSNGAYIELEKYLPFFGYNSSFEIGNEAVRAEKGLAPLMIVAASDSNYHLIDYETTVSTAGDQQVVTVGRLLNTWKQSNRQYFHYKTTQPINYMLALSSARYAVLEEEYKGIDLRLYYQPEQASNTRAMLQAMKDAIDYGNAHFCSYPFAQLALAEIPQYAGAATAYPGVLFSAERISFMSDFRDSSRFNQAYAVTAHETAHQWWANKLSPLPAAGDAMLTESLAKYTEDILVEKRFGKGYLRNYLCTDNQLYFALSGGEKELPLVSVAGQPFVHYQKGGLAFYAIKELLGEDRLNQCLQQLLARHAAPRLRATAADLLNELYKVATPAEVKFIDEQLKRVIVYDNRLQVISCAPLTNGQFAITLQVQVEKTDKTSGQAQSIAPADSITVAVFDKPTHQWNKITKPLYWQRHFFSKKQTVFTIVVGKKPAVVILDPLVHLRDADLEDNEKLIGERGRVE